MGQVISGHSLRERERERERERISTTTYLTYKKERDQTILRDTTSPHTTTLPPDYHTPPRP